LTCKFHSLGWRQQEWIDEVWITAAVPIFEPLARAAAQRGLQFLVIGGHAVMRHGFMRATEDVDILVNKEDRPGWEAMLSQLGYASFHDGGTFLQLTPTNGHGWELDLMFVAHTTFDAMSAEAIPTQIEGVSVLVPSLNHLLALKLHALNHNRGLRSLKDFEDIGQLIAANRIDVRTEVFRQLVLKYGDPSLYERITQACTE
jgi:predicted nucleotidyltransferase